MNVVSSTSTDIRHIFKVSSMETILGSYRKSLCGHFLFCTFHLRPSEAICQDCLKMEILEELGE